MSSPDVKKNKDGVYEYERGAKVPVYSSIAFGIVAAAIFLYSYTKKLGKVLNPGATAAVTAIFAITMFAVERISIERGYWAWNISKMLAAYSSKLFIFGIPAEEVLVVYIIAPPTTLLMWLVFTRRRKNDGSNEGSVDR